MYKIKHQIHTDENDLELWKLFREGDELAYTELVRKFSKRLFNYGIRFTTDRDFVKDCIQDVFYELWHRRERIGQAACVSAYIFKALRLRIFKEQAKWQHAEEPGLDYEFIVEFNIESKLINEQSAQELSSKIESVLNAFPQRQKEIIYLRFYENLDYEKIAQIMGLNRQSLYNLLQKSFIRFRKDWVALSLVLLSRLL